jgi:hypothetical protein
MTIPEKCFYVPGEMSICDTATPDGRSFCYGHTLEEMQSRYPGAQLVPWDEASKAIRAAMDDHYKVGIPELSTAEQFDYALNVLPPCRWTRNSVGQAFFVSELVCGDIADWYLNVGDRFWHMYNTTRANVADMLSACLAS